ncbi:hypothetical protein BVRB_018250 isoform B [Beta vulgaris subsp. vulgaris]|uniref:Uncharacterized protein n=1 Tax=Beta vulgaris subsp. vulgaris TaxID=3555 RepID=A0A0J8BFP2_BETVV|nr:hypothetical protein BVRB_018250 isoform B [Beta vulgaris subsp. vulgaris]
MAASETANASSFRQACGNVIKYEGVIHEFDPYFYYRDCNTFSTISLKQFAKVGSGMLFEAACCTLF